MHWWSDPRQRRWVLWAILAMSFLFVSIYRLSTAVIADRLMAAFTVTGSELGLLHASFFLVYAVMQLPTGLLVDRVGPRRTAAVGTAVMNVGAIGFAIATGYPAAMAGRFLIGLGGSVIFVSMLRFCANWYNPREFNTMNGLCFASGGFGGLLATTPFAIAVGRLGWRSTIVGLGLLGLVVAGLIATIVRDSPARADLPDIGGANDGARIAVDEMTAALSGVLRDRWTWVVIVLMFAAGGINLTLFGLWGVPYVVQVYDTSVEFASLFTFVGGVGAVLGPPAIGNLAARLDRRLDLVIVGGVCYTLALTIPAVQGDPHPFVLAGVFFVVGALLGAFVLTFPIIKDRHGSRISGIAMGTINGASFVGASVLPTALGWILDVYWTGEIVAGARVYTETGYRVAFGVVAVMAATTVVCAIWLRLAAGTAAAPAGGA